MMLPQVLVCTTSALCNPSVRDKLLSSRSVVRMMVDEASQIYVGEYLTFFDYFATTLRQVVFSEFLINYLCF